MQYFLKISTHHLNYIYWQHIFVQNLIPRYNWNAQQKNMRLTQWSFYNHNKNIKNPRTVSESCWILLYKTVCIKSCQCHDKPQCQTSAAAGSVSCCVSVGKLTALLLLSSAVSLCGVEVSVIEGSEHVTGIASAGDDVCGSTSVLWWEGLLWTSGSAPGGSDSAPVDVDSCVSLSSHFMALASPAASVAHDMSPSAAESEGTCIFTSDVLRSKNNKH